MPRPHPPKEKSAGKSLLENWKQFTRKRTLKAFAGVIVATATGATAAYSFLPEALVHSVKAGVLRRIGLGEKKPYAFAYKATPNLEQATGIWQPATPDGEGSLTLACQSYRVVKAGETLMLRVPDDERLTEFEAEFLLAVTGREDSASWLLHADAKGTRGYLFRLTYPTKDKPAEYEVFSLKNGKTAEKPLFSESTDNLYDAPIGPDHLLAVKIRVEGRVATTTFKLNRNLRIHACPDSPQRACCDPQTPQEQITWLSLQHPMVIRAIDSIGPLRGDAEDGAIGFRAGANAPMLIRNVTLRPLGVKGP